MVLFDILLNFRAAGLGVMGDVPSLSFPENVGVFHLWNLALKRLNYYAMFFSVAI
jgi:hypothetical protein